MYNLQKYGLKIGQKIKINNLDTSSYSTVGKSKVELTIVKVFPHIIVCENSYHEKTTLSIGDLVVGTAMNIQISK